MRLVLLAHPEHKRVASLQAALHSRRLPEARVLAWRDWLRQPERLFSLLDQPCWLKLEAPGEDADTQQLLIAQGARLQNRPVPPLLAHGEIGHAGLWFAGFESALQGLAGALAQRPWVRCLNTPDAIRLMCDKLVCQHHLQHHGLAIPGLLGPFGCFAELQYLMAQCRQRRVFVKQRYGSSASGVVAVDSNGRGQWRASSSVEMVAGEGRLFNSKRIRQYRDTEVVRLIDRLASNPLYAEAWVPKPMLDGQRFDLRVVCLAGQPMHRVARFADCAMTNLHLGASRRSVSDCLSPAAIERLERTARKVAANLPGGRVAGVDLIATERRVHVLEVNAFGDWLPRLQWHGQTIHEAQIALLQRLHCNE